VILIVIAPVDRYPDFGNLAGISTLFSRSAQPALTGFRGDGKEVPESVRGFHR